MNIQAKKRKRTDISVEQKREICEYKVLHSTFSNIDIMRHFNSLWGINLSPSTMSEILKDREKYLNSNYQPNVKRIRLAENPELEKCLAVWLSSNTEQNKSVSDEMIIKKAKEFGQKIGVSCIGFKYSNGWLHRFKYRFYIRQSKISRYLNNTSDLKVSTITTKLTSTESSINNCSENAEFFEEEIYISDYHNDNILPSNNSIIQEDQAQIEENLSDEDIAANVNEHAVPIDVSVNPKVTYKDVMNAVQILNDYFLQADNLSELVFDMLDKIKENIKN